MVNRVPGTDGAKHRAYKRDFTFKFAAHKKAKAQLYTSHFSHIECNSSPRKLAEIALNQRTAHTSSKVEHIASLVHSS